VANVSNPDKESKESGSTLISKNKSKKELLTNEVLLKNNLANAADIHAALLGDSSFGTKIERASAKATDILQALNFNEAESTSLQNAEPELQVTKSEEIKPLVIEEIVPMQVINQETNKLTNTELPLALTPNYYLNSPTGFVVQIVGFTDMALLVRFNDKYPNLEYFSYQKKLNGQLFVVLTTKIFDTKEQAREALQALPQDIIERGVWVKALLTVQNEINIS